jgi:hypothetical protein
MSLARFLGLHRPITAPRLRMCIAKEPLKRFVEYIFLQVNEIRVDDTGRYFGA